MGKTVEYQGYTIESIPYHDPNGGKWQLRVLISMQSPHGLQTREFSPHVLYPTVEEADIHGIAFGQHIIDGKVAGWSVMDMKPTDRRATPRFEVQFRTTFCLSATLEGTGVILDLSMGGCRVESSIPLTTGVPLELRIYVPGLEWPLMVEAASVQWVSGQIFGLAFFQMRESERHRLGELLERLQDRSSTD